MALKEEQIIVEEKKAQTDALIVSIGKEKAVVDEAVEAGREDEEAAGKLQVGPRLCWQCCNVLLESKHLACIVCNSTTRHCYSTAVDASRQRC